MSILSFLFGFGYQFTKNGKKFTVKSNENSNTSIVFLIDKLKELKIDYDKTVESVKFYHDISKNDIMISILENTRLFDNGKLHNDGFTFTFNTLRSNDDDLNIKYKLMQKINANNLNVSISVCGNKILFVLSLFVYV